MTDLRTEKERLREARHAKICSAYCKIRREQPACSRNRALIAVAKAFGVTPMTIKLVVKKSGDYDRDFTNSESC